MRQKGKDSALHCFRPDPVISNYMSDLNLFTHQYISLSIYIFIYQFIYLSIYFSIYFDLSMQSSLIPDPKLYVWDIENDAIIYYNFASGKNDQVRSLWLR